MVLSILLAPSVALASWWNPFDWFNNWSFSDKPESETQILENRIQELEKKLSAVSTTTSETVAATSTPTSIVPIVNKVVPVSNPAPVKTQVQTQLPPVADICLNIAGIQSQIPDGMFIYGSNKECLTQNEISYIANKMAEEKNREIDPEIKSNDPIYSEECEDAQDELKKVNAQQAKMDQTDYGALADFVVLKVNPALDKVDIACRLNMPIRKVEPTKSTNCYVNYYSNNANITCYSN